MGPAWCKRLAPWAAQPATLQPTLAPPLNICSSPPLLSRDLLYTGQEAAEPASLSPRGPDPCQKPHG